MLPDCDIRTAPPPHKLTPPAPTRRQAPFCGALSAPSDCLPQPQALNPQPSTLNPHPSTLNPPPSTLNPQPSTLNLQERDPNASRIHRSKYVDNVTSLNMREFARRLHTISLKMKALLPPEVTPHPTPYTHTLHPKPYTLHHTPHTLHPTRGGGGESERERERASESSASSHHLPQDEGPASARGGPAPTLDPCIWRRDSLDLPERESERGEDTASGGESEVDR